MRTLAIITISMLLGALAQGPVFAAPEDAILELRIGAATDDLCRWLSYTERAALAIEERRLLMTSVAYRDYLGGRLPAEDYFDADDAIREAAKAEADSTRCASAALKVVAALRDRAFERIYGALMLADERSRMFHDNPGYSPLTAEEKLASASYYEVMSAHYGADWPKRLDAVRASMTATTGDGSIGMEEIFAESDELTAFLVAEVAANSLGYRISASAANPGGAPALIHDARGTVVFLWSGPLQFKIDDELPINVLLAVNQQGEGRVMTYGENQNRMGEGRADLIMRTAPWPKERGYDPRFFGIEQRAFWGGLAEVFAAPRVDEPCMGGPCFAIPRPIMDILFGYEDGEWLGIVLAADAGAPPPEASRYPLDMASTGALQAWHDGGK